MTSSSCPHKVTACSKAALPALMMCTMVGGRKPHIRAWKGLALAAPPPCRGVDRAQDTRVLVIPNCGFRDSWTQKRLPPSHTSGQGLFPKGVLSSLPFHSMAEADKDLWRPSSPTTCSSRVTRSGMPRAMSRWVLSISKGGDSTTCTGNLCQCLATFTVAKLFSYV